jgi:hypothetical protein
MNQEEVNIYLSARKLVDILNSSYGQELKNKKPELFMKAEEIIKKYKNTYSEYRISENQELRDFYNTINEAEDLLKIMPSDSHDEIKQISDIITQNSKSLQDKLFYEPQIFYSKYMANLTSSKNDFVNKDVVDNERFKLWFAGSRCVESNGEPKVVYHGTGGLNMNEFDEFTFDLFPASYFAETKAYSDWFANIKGGNSILYRVYLRVLNPIDISLFKVDRVTYDDFVNYIELIYGFKLPFNLMLKSSSDRNNGLWAWQYLRGGVDWLKLIKSNSEFDGFVYYENNPDDMENGKERVTKAWLVMNANQIKSADFRNTTFSLQSNSIKMGKGGIAC